MSLNFETMQSASLAYSPRFTLHTMIYSRTGKSGEGDIASKSYVTDTLLYVYPLIFANLNERKLNDL